MPMTAVVILAAGIVLAVFLSIAIRRHRMVSNAKMQSAAESLRLMYEPKGEKAFRDAWSAVPGLPKRGEVHHVMFGEYAGLPITCFRHRYVVSTGKSAAVIMHWVFSTDTPAWPEMHLRRRSWVGKVLGQRSNVSDNFAFDRGWVIKAESKEFAAGLLSESVQEFLLRPTTQICKRASPRWHFVGGKACMVVRADVKPEHLRAGLDHLVGMWTALTPA